MIISAILIVLEYLVILVVLRFNLLRVYLEYKGNIYFKSKNEKVQMKIKMRRMEKPGFKKLLRAVPKEQK